MPPSTLYMEGHQHGRSPSFNIKLYMADGSCVHPTGIIEDVSVHVGKFFVPNDFVVMSIDADVLVPIILWRTFLVTTEARNDVKEGLHNLTIGDEEVEFQFNKTMKGPSIDEMIETVLKADEVVRQVFVEEVIEEKKEVEYLPGFLPRPKNHKVASIRENDYAFWGLFLVMERRRKGRSGDFTRRVGKTTAG